MPRADLILTNASQVATPLGPPPFAGPRQGAIDVLDSGAVAFRDGLVAAVAPEDRLASWDAEAVFDCQGGTIVPGFVDAHTHLVFAGERAGELAMKLEGASYQEILEAGGGIHSTVEATRAASVGELSGSAGERLDRLLSLGTTTVEAKSGYALSVEGELAMLDAIAALDAHPVDVVGTLLGAHAFPRDQEPGAFLEAVCDELTPAAAKQGVARYCDAFVDQGAFTVEQGRQVLEAGKREGLSVRVHADELARTGAFELGLELDAASIDHLNQLSQEDVERMGRAVEEGFGGTATLCPVTPFTSELPYAPARALIAHGVPVALGSDLNPNAWSEGMGLAMSLAVHGMRMTPAEVLVASTVNSAHSLGLQDRGRFEEGLVGDAVVLDVPSYEHIGYRLPSPPVRAVVKAGEVVT